MRVLIPITFTYSLAYCSICRTIGEKAYREKASVRDGKDDGWIDTWLQSFVQEHGIGRVEQVLYRYLSNRVPPMKVEQADQKQADQPLMLGKVLPLEQDSFSGCLLLKDDNDILNEWIAYHYHVIKLRTLVVAIDPSSQTSPSVVFDRWRDLVEIVEWTDENFMPEFFLNKQYDLVPNMIGNMTNSSTSQFHKDDVELDQRQVQQELQDINNHRFRQATFFGSCIRELRQQNKTWMLHVDSDEYMVLHHEIKQQNHWRNLTLDPEIRPNSILEFLKGAAVRYPKAVNYPCISMPRLLFGAKEDDENDAVRLTNIPKPFDGKKFETVRWKYHTNFDKDVKINGKPKVIMDLSGIPPQSNFISKDIFSIHRPGMRLCRGDKRILFEKKTWFPITVNHYLGSWERYNHRDDARRNRRVSSEPGLYTYNPPRPSYFALHLLFVLHSCSMLRTRPLL